MSLRKRPWLTALVIITVAGSAGAAYALIPSGSPRRVASERMIGRTSPSAVVRFSLVLNISQRRLHHAMAGVYDPRSPLYHHFIGALAFGRRFGISDQQLVAVHHVLRQDGIRIRREYPQRTAIEVAAPAGVVDRVFGIHLMDYSSAAGRVFHAPVGAPVVPRALRGSIAGIAGLSGRFLPRPDDVPEGGVSPTVAGAAYDVSPLYRQGVRGQGERVALISFARFSQSDLDSFSQQFNLPRLVPQDIPSTQDGGAVDHSADGVGEADLDAEMVHEIAPDAQILNYNSPQLTAAGNDAFGELIDQIVADGRANLVSDSYGYCELMLPASDIRRDEQAIDAAVLHGITIFKSSGDSGAYQCQRVDASDTRLSVEWPASSPGVVAVGGTTLSTTPTGNYAGETAWEGTISQAGGGGGVCAIVPRPAWQQAPGVINRFSNGRRELPDVSASADPFYGWAIFRNGDVRSTGGTSAASPFMAGAMALIEQYARQHGIAKLGFVAPMLYGIAGAPQQAPPFHDVTVGNNRYYQAATGWDFATGLGSPDVYNLAQDVVSYLKTHPSS